MKLFICDYSKIKVFQLPKTGDNFYLLNFKYNLKNSYYSESLTLKATEDCFWSIIADEKVSISVDGVYYEQIVLTENIFFTLQFADMPDFVPVYVVSDMPKFIPYSVTSLEKITIGSYGDCTISYNGKVMESIILFRNGNDIYVDRNDVNPLSTYINSSTYDIMRLSVGDMIFIKGIRIIYMRDFILIHDFATSLVISQLMPLNYDNDSNNLMIVPVNDMEKNVKLFHDDQIFVHTPRMKTGIEKEEIVIADPPGKENMQKMPAIITFLSSGTMFLFSFTTLFSSLRSFVKGNMEYFDFVMSMISCGAMLMTGLLLPYLTNKWNTYRMRKQEKLRQRKYREYLASKAQYINETIKKQEGILNLSYASLNQIKNNIINGSSEIWSREIFDDDFLSIMLGTGNAPAEIRLPDNKREFYMEEDDLKDLAEEVAGTKYELQNVPIVFSLLKQKVMPIVLYSKNAYEYMMYIMLQIIYYHSGNDLKIVTITSEENEYKWEFMKYLPHSWDRTHEKRFFATNDDELQQISMYMEQEYVNRTSNAGGVVFNEYYLIVTDNYKLAREMSIINKILSSEENFGFSLIIFESSLKDLPSRFTTMVNVRDEGSCIVDRNSIKMEQRFFDTSDITQVEIEKYSKVIANIPLKFESGDSAVPSSLTFLDMFYAGRVDRLNVKERWFSNNPTISLKSTIGFKENNKSVELDLHEKYHGPHGLIAGSTGSGKSEFIITYILSMAINYHPYEVQFILIDYKGGGLAGAFENRETGVRIPHLVGTITNLDVSEMNRTLVSIKSELQRRQRVFNETREKLGESTIDIYKYQRFYREGKIEKPLAHLFIISDEFAELKAQQPDFMDELVSAARIGRSLGVHLILATQKPSGVVDDQIWSNSRFKVCLKVQTTEDSMEMLKKTDAAYIKEAGRFYLQVGNDEIFELGQSGWSGAKYIPTDNVVKKVNDDIVFLSNSGDILRSINEEVKKEDVIDQGDQLTNIVKYLYDLAIQENIQFSTLWLPNIPEIIFYDNLIKKYSLKASPYLIDPIIGEYDNPSSQEQGYVHLPLSLCGNTIIVGAPGSGKNTLVSTIIYSTIINHSSNEVNIYIIDLGAEKLKIFQKAPQVGDVLTTDDADKIKFLFYMLKDEKDRRFSYYADNGGDYIKGVTSGSSPFPTILLIIHDFDVFKEMFDDLYSDEFGPFTRNCSKVGIILIVTATVSNSLGYMNDGNFPKKIMLNMVDSYSYSDFFTRPPIPKKNPGRGLIEMDQVYEFQTSLLFEESIYEKKLNYIILQLERYLLDKAKKVPVIPEDVTIDLLRPRIKSLSNVPLGVNIKTAQIGTFNFDNLVNVMSSQEDIVVKKFFPRFIEILSNIKGLRIIVVDCLKMELSVPEGVKYCTGGFKKIMSTINDNVNKCKETQKDVSFAIVIIGYIQLQQYLANAEAESGEVDDSESSSKEVITIDELIMNSKDVPNFRYILYDVSARMRKISNSEIDSFYKHNNGVWIGKDFDVQSLIESNGYSSVNLANNNVTVVNKGIANYLKY